MPEQRQTEESVKANVKRWLSRIRCAEDKWQPDFERMRKNTEFASGLQWLAQKSLVDEDRYIANITLQVIRHKVANLYARNPSVDVTRRERIDFTLWDGQMDSLQDAYMRVMNGRIMGAMDMEAEAIMADFMHGRQMQELVDRICLTLKLVYGYQMDCSKPDFKEQMKQLVTRVVTCGVGYCRLYFVRGGESPISTVETRHTVEDRARMADVIMNKLDDDEIDEDSPEVEQLRTLGLSMGFSMQSGDEYELEERLEFDFPPSTSVIPDSRCRSLKDFVGARFVAQRFDLPLDDINEVFGQEIKQDELTGEQPDEKKVLEYLKGEEDDEKKKRYAVYEVLDYTTKTSFFIMSGFQDYLREPEPLDPCVSGFWPLFALTFNDIESDPDSNTSIFPPSDVDLLRSPQKEWNRSRQALREHRNANAPKYLVRKGQLTENDKANIQNAVPNEVIEVEGMPSDTEPGKWLQPMQHAALDPALYDPAPLEQDLMLAGGAQQANIGPAQPDVTATVGTIAEQSRQTVSASNVDDLDGFLSRLSQAGVEMILRAFSEPVVQRIAGVGALWPFEDRANYLNMIQIKVKAASSGRPNQALSIANFERIAPQLIAAGANPLAIIEEAVKRLDDQLDVAKFFPLPGMLPQGQQQQEQEGGTGEPKQPLQELPSQTPVPLAAA